MTSLRSLMALSLLLIAQLVVVAPAAAGWFATDDTISLAEAKKAASSSTPMQKNAATIRVQPYVDARKDMGPKKIGMTTQRISGIWGKELIIDREVAQLVTATIKQKFEDGGFQILDEGTSLYELSGVVKELSYQVGVKDEVSILLETTLKEVATGKVIWSGEVIERPKGRFAGVSGNSKADIAAYLKREVGIATQKIYEAISTSLVALRPELFNMIPGTQPIAGVTVLQSATTQPNVNANDKPVQGVVNGVLALSTKPARAKVYVDGVYFGMSPLRSDVDAGVHEVSVKLEGYKSVSEKVSIRKGEVTELELVFTR